MGHSRSAALLGAYSAQLGFGLPSIGGKDSMSGSFYDEEHGEIDVPPTLVSFAVDISDTKHVVSPEFKKAGSKIVLFTIEKDAHDLPVLQPDHGWLRENLPRYGVWKDYFRICG